MEMIFLFPQTFVTSFFLCKCFFSVATLSYLIWVNSLFCAFFTVKIKKQYEIVKGSSRDLWKQGLLIELHEISVKNSFSVPWNSLRSLQLFTSGTVFYIWQV